MIAGMLADLIGKEIEVFLDGDDEPSIGGVLQTAVVYPGESVAVDEPLPAVELAPVAYIEVLDDRGLRSRVVGDSIAVVSWNADA